MWRWIFLALVVWCNQAARAQGGVEEDFAPDIMASCRAGFMEINVLVNNLAYTGMVHARDTRKPQCMAVGNGSGNVTLRLPLITEEDDPDYCGVRINKTSNERYAAIAVRIHETLELADDKFYVIKCGLQGFVNNRKEASFVNLQMLDKNHKLTKETVYGRAYTLRVYITRPDDEHTFQVKECFSFGEPDYSTPLSDERGCPDTRLMSHFVYNYTGGTAEAVLHKMFRFHNTSRIHFQCDVEICKGPCEEIKCEGRPERLTAQGRAIPNANAVDGDEGQKANIAKATTSVYVLDPDKEPFTDCDWSPPWLWILCVVLAALFIIMMIINIFLCSSMTCSCTNTEVIEKEPSIIEEFDPYRSWHGSQYGSRYSLNGKGYTSGASTMMSVRSGSSHSDHYAIVHSRPHSRYSGHHSLKHDRHHDRHHHDRHRGPPSTAGSHYSETRMSAAR
ncbi:uncharacterized protein LOC143036420 isoform X2 [Oratosquilla oratoria]|uniref:uncharacterized protein LOC143036420 isoform X2 n=1 Tax=Oratosquilla oratoria TaxID=337810 RepID=UPI003F76904C